MPIDHKPGDRPLIGFSTLRWAGRHSDLATMTQRSFLRPMAASLGGLALLVSANTSAGDRLGPINITASRAAPLPAPTMPETVISRAEIERSQARSLAELLQGRAGLNVTNLGGAGKPTNISIWGQGASRTAVFIDGIRIGSVSAGQSYLEHIPLAQVERVEIVRGPRSGQWGADAGGGVIQIFTRQNSDPGTNVSGGIGVGGRGQRDADLHVGGRQGGFDYSLGAALQRTDGFDAQSDPNTSPDDDGYKNKSAQAQLGYRFDNGGHISAQVLASTAEVDYDGAFQDYSEIEQRTFGVSGSSGRIGFWQLRARAGRHVDDQDSYKGDVFVSRFDTQRDTLFLANDFFIFRNTTLTIGADHTDDKLASNYDFDERSRRNQALFAQANVAAGQYLEIQAALRRDFNEQFGTTNTGSLDLSYALTDRWTLTAGHGTAFTAPSFNYLYFPGSGNPDLDPERTRTSRAGVRWSHANWSLDATAFRTTADDLIASPPPFYQPYNVDEATIRGAELNASWSSTDWTSQASLTYLSTEDRATGDRLARQPRWSGRLDLDRRLGPVSLGTALHGQSGSKGGPWVEDNQGFLTADLRASYRFERHWRIEARLQNLFDRDYQVIHGYNEAPRGLFVGLRYGR